jgi:hypothetical protein
VLLWPRRPLALPAPWHCHLAAPPGPAPGPAHPHPTSPPSLSCLPLQASWWTAAWARAPAATRRARSA